uniref:Uncharacterized protein n=1 Tax=Anguilla anguilla TaxID=7936 RepID=A0A0E9XHU4_ANGAN
MLQLSFEDDFSVTSNQVTQPYGLSCTCRIIFGDTIFFSWMHIVLKRSQRVMAIWPKLKAVNFQHFSMVLKFHTILHAFNFKMGSTDLCMLPAST